MKKKPKHKGKIWRKKGKYWPINGDRPRNNPNY